MSLVLFRFPYARSVFSGLCVVHIQNFPCYPNDPNVFVVSCMEYASCLTTVLKRTIKEFQCYTALPLFESVVNFWRCQFFQYWLCESSFFIGLLFC
jgi:hypothetical protein